MNTPHLRIRASAGTGKTFRLTDRIIELLFVEAKPEKIIALTFTRKAAGEFLIKTLRKLAELSRDPTCAAEFCVRRGINRKKSPTDFLILLRKVVESLDRMEFGTLDSFFFRVVTAFGAEMGLGPSPRLLDEVSTALEEREVLRELTDSLSKSGLDLVQELLRGPGRAKLSPLGADFSLLDTIETLYILHPERDAWGDARRIWGINGCPWETLSAVQQDIPENCDANVALAIAELQSFGRPGSKLNTVAKRLLAQAEALLKGQAVTIEYRNKEITLSPSERAAVRDAVAACLWRTLDPKLTQARRWHTIASTLRDVRERRQMSDNTLRFADLPTFLARLTDERTTPNAAELQYRLDGWFDHWLLDEFQDTNRIQWQAIQPLLDEVLQDASGTRSFFYVGDVKQSIYRFRHGDPSLFDEIFHYYTKHAPEHIAEESLGESRRSAQEIIDVIQKTFCPDAITRAGINPSVLQKWSAAWTTHSAHKNNPEPGYAHKIHCPPADYWQRIMEIIKQTRILERPPLTCAVIVRTNDAAHEAVQEFTRQGISATTESSPHISTDNPCGVAVLMAARLVADPSDSFARVALQCSPLGAFDDGFAARGLDNFHLLGAYGMVAEWLHRFRIVTPHAFDPSRAASIRRAAREFDDNNSSSPRAFADFLSAYADPTSAQTGTVQVMTIHKAKGLEFDMVFFPVSKDSRMDKRDGAEIFCANEPNLGVRPWILGLPPESLSIADPVMEAAGKTIRDQSTFDDLCAFYVAETRARRALVVLLPETSHA